MEMFDKMIESNSAAAEFKPRRTYFLVSSVIVGALFLAAVVVSIYAGDIGLGNMDFELSEMLTPIESSEPDPLPEPERLRSAQNTPASELPSRIVNMARVDETQPVPSSTSVVPNQYLSHPLRPFELSNRDTNLGDPSIARNPNALGDGPGLSTVREPKSGEGAIPEPPPALKPELPKAAPPKSIGVVNGIAINLPRPPYPPAAAAVGVQGKVDVQVTIDETGKVISAKAASGHPLLKQAAEKAAWSARFTPTLLSKVPVKVTGVIVYNFVRN
jgi:TonB family protein